VNAAGASAVERSKAGKRGGNSTRGTPKHRSRPKRGEKRGRESQQKPPPQSENQEPKEEKKVGKWAYEKKGRAGKEASEFGLLIPVARKKKVEKKRG